MIRQRFKNRTDAGQRLARLLAAYANRSDVLVLALPRGGVPVAFEVAQALRAPLDVFVVRKLGVPGRQELAMGAVASGGTRVLNEDVLHEFGIAAHLLDAVTAREQQELERRERRYRGARPFPELANRTVILIDDGLATGATMRAAVRALRQQCPARLVVAVPVGDKETCDALTAEVDEFVCAVVPDRLHGIGLWYEDFSQSTDDEVCDLLRGSAELMAVPLAS